MERCQSLVGGRGPYTGTYPVPKGWKGRLMEFALEGQRIARVCADFAVTILTVDGVELRIETAFSIAGVDDETDVVVSPAHLGSSASIVLGLLQRQVVGASIGESGRLAVGFTDGIELVCEPDEQFEAWSLTLPAGDRMVCLPGGGTASWSN